MKMNNTSRYEPFHSQMSSYYNLAKWELNFTIEFSICKFLNAENFCFGGGSPQKLHLAQLTSAKKVLSSVNESPDTSFEYVPPKVNLIALGFVDCILHFGEGKKGFVF